MAAGLARRGCPLIRAGPHPTSTGNLAKQTFCSLLSSCFPVLGLSHMCPGAAVLEARSSPILHGHFHLSLDTGSRSHFHELWLGMELGSCLAQKESSQVLDDKASLSKATCTQQLSLVTKSVACRVREVLPLCSALGKLHPEHCAQCWAPPQFQAENCCRDPSRGLQR